MDSDFLTYLDMMTNGPSLTFLSIISEIIIFIAISSLSIALLIIPYKMHPVKAEYKKKFILFSIALVLIFSLIYPRIPINPYLDYYLSFWKYIRPIIYVAVLSVLEYLLLSSKKSSKKQAYHNACSSRYSYTDNLQHCKVDCIYHHIKHCFFDVFILKNQG